MANGSKIIEHKTIVNQLSILALINHPSIRKGIRGKILSVRGSMSPCHLMKRVRRRGYCHSEGKCNYALLNASKSMSLRGGRSLPTKQSSLYYLNVQVYIIIKKDVNNKLDCFGLNSLAVTRLKSPVVKQTSLCPPIEGDGLKVRDYNPHTSYGGAYGKH